jgi:hypothetical protein
VTTRGKARNWNPTARQSAIEAVRNKKFYLKSIKIF